MAKKKVSQTATQKEYKKQLKRIKQFIRRAEKRGYVFQKDVIPKEPKRVTKASVKKLAKLTPEVLYKKAVYASEKTAGEIIKGTEGLKLERKERSKKSAETRKYKLKEPVQEATNTQDFIVPENILENGYSEIVIQNFKSQILSFPKEISDKIIALINTMIKEQGADGVAYALEHMPMQFYEYINRKGYDSQTSIQEFASDLINYLPEASDVYKEELMEAFEYNEMGYELE